MPKYFKFNFSSSRKLLDKLRSNNCRKLFYFYNISIKVYKPFGQYPRKL